MVKALARGVQVAADVGERDGQTWDLQVTFLSVCDGAAAQQGRRMPVATAGVYSRLIPA
jgi:hypothetical protein